MALFSTHVLTHPRAEHAAKARFAAGGIGAEVPRELTERTLYESLPSWPDESRGAAGWPVGVIASQTSSPMVPTVCRGLHYNPS